MGKTSKKEGVQQMVEVFYQHGVRRIVFSPGSRNAPLIIAFANDDRFESFVIPDERSAAFYALGMAEQSKSPVAVVCTSGTASLNYYPAVSEAFYRNIPLIIVSADRPKEWIDQGDGQTIRQENVFQNHICGVASFYENPENENQRWYNQRKAEELLNISKSTPGGPVHINFPFSEPLYEGAEIKEENFKKTEILNLYPQFSPSQEKEIQEIWDASPKKLILCGQMSNNGRLNEQLKALTHDKSVAVVVENTSNLQDRSFVHCIDRTIESFLTQNQTVFQPDLLITLGGAIVSKKIKKFLRKNKPKHHWKIGQSFHGMDTYQSLSKSIPMEATDFFNVVLKKRKENHLSRYGEQWKQLDHLAKGQQEKFIREASYSDLTVFDLILDALPDSSTLHLGNSSVIRYAQLFDPIKGINYYCNRGTSGIDGAMSTALGNALVNEKKRHICIIGDMSFFYDSNAFWNAHLPSNFRVFLINNGGGGIFDLIEGPKSTPNLDKYFVAAHTNSAAHICKAFNVNYCKANSIEEIEEQLDVFLEVMEKERPAVMEIFTRRETNLAIFSAYFRAIKVKEMPILEM